MRDTEYHKIQSVYLRDPQTKHKNFLIGQWSEPEFGYLAGNDWVWTEKVDGTNMRISYYPKPEPDLFDVLFQGRTDNAQIPVFLFDRLLELFTPEKMAQVFDVSDNARRVVLYGEGYGAKIQKGGGLYKPDGVDFILFDVRIGDIWLTRESVEDIAAKLAIPVVPIIGTGPLEAAIDYTRRGFASRLPVAMCMAEGLVMRPAVELLTRTGSRVITKVKTRDFQI